MNTNLGNRLDSDIRELMYSIEYGLKGNQIHDSNFLESLTRYTHSLKSLALQGGSETLSRVIHDIEGLLLRIGSLDSGDDTVFFTDELSTLVSQLRDTFQSTDSKILLGSTASVIPLTPETVLAKLLKDDVEKALKLLSKGYFLSVLVFQGAEDLEDRLSLRFQQIKSKLEKKVVVCLAAQDQDYFGCVIVTDRVQNVLDNLASFSLPFTSLITEHTLDYRDFLKLCTAKELDFSPDFPSGIHNSLDVVGDFFAQELSRQNKKAILRLYGTIPYEGHVYDTVLGVIFQGIRNAVTHGIETPTQRELSGKTSSGNIQVSVLTAQSKVIIKIEDDGQGFQTDSESEGISENHFDEYSGRGIGFNMMHWNIENLLWGSFLMESNPGKGTRLIMELPRELEVISGYAVIIKNEGLFIPQEVLFGKIDSIKETNPSRIARFWYGQAYYENLGIKTIHFTDDHWQINHLDEYSNEIGNKPGLILRHNTDLILIVVDKIVGKETLALKKKSNKVFSQSLSKIIPLYQD